jgi:hypothetical protein
MKALHKPVVLKTPLNPAKGDFKKERKTFNFLEIWLNNE